MRYLYIVLGILAIFIITMFTFREDLIYYNYAKFIVNKEEKVENNNYYYDDNFMYIDDYSELEIHNKDELYETVYYLVNSGVTYAKRYFSLDYKNFEEDYNDLFSNKLKLNAINNFVHPYNSFDSIEASLKGYVLEINISYNSSYNESKIKLINDEVDNLVNELLKPTMTIEEKIKTFHDYIINNSVYDEDYCVKENKEDCITTSPYQSDTAYGVLFEHTGICSGYTDLMAIFLNKLGIVNYRVTNEEHTWNAVKLDNTWYHLDATWDDPINDEDILSHTYFMITTLEDETLEEPHSFNKEIFIELN